MKARFLVFCYPDYYPGGGLYDVVAVFDNLEEAQAEYKEQEDYDHRGEILDIVEGVVWDHNGESWDSKHVDEYFQRLIKK